MLRALGHADRRAFVRACLDAPRSAGELAALSSLALASVSEHLKVLRKCGLLVLEIRGRFWFYRTDADLLAATVAALVDLQPAPSPQARRTAARRRRPAAS